MAEGQRAVVALQEVRFLDSTKDGLQAQLGSGWRCARGSAPPPLQRALQPSGGLHSRPAAASPGSGG
eukprot:15148531-Alexandrium_andersonii.AAC.1